MVKKLINTEKKLGKHGGRLVIHNLPFSMKEKSFLKLVKKIGEIKEHQLPWNQEENRNKGFGFVEYTKKNLGAKLIKNLNGKKISGRVLAVDWAVSKDVHQKLQNKPEEEEKQEEKQEEQEEIEEEKPQRQRPNKFYEGRTLFLSNLSYDTRDQDLEYVFGDYGELQYANIVLQPGTDIPKGTGFVCFKEQESAQKAFEAFQKQDDSLRIDGRIIRVMLAVDKNSAQNLKLKKKEKEDKRNLDLVKIGMIDPKSEDFQQLNKLDVQMRLRAARMKKEKLKNPNVFLSKTRIVIRNLPKDCDDKRLKQVAINQLLTKYPEAKRKKLLKQVKVMREKDRLDRNGIPRSKGFGFIDCFKHEIAKDLIELISNNSKVFGPKRKPVIEFALEDHRMLRIREMKKAKNEEQKSQKKKQYSRGKRQREKRRLAKERGDVVEEKQKVELPIKRQREPEEKPVKAKKVLKVKAIEYSTRRKRDADTEKLENAIQKYTQKLFGTI